LWRLQHEAERCAQIEKDVFEMNIKPHSYIIYEVHDGVATLTLNRPPLNVLNIAILREFLDELNQATQDESIGALVLNAKGKLFSAGVDIEDHTPDKVGEMIPLFHEVCQLLADFPAPTIAAVHGHALGGGCELVLCCDLAIMAEEAKIGQPEIRLAAIAPIAAIRLSALVGYRAAADMLFTGRDLDAREALRIGLVNEVAPAEQVEKKAIEKAFQMSSMSRAAQRLNKRALQRGLDNWSAQIDEMEGIYLNELMHTADALEGLEAFLEKRPPVWTHK